MNPSDNDHWVHPHKEKKTKDKSVTTPASNCSNTTIITSITITISIISVTAVAATIAVGAVRVYAVGGAPDVTKIQGKYFEGTLRFSLIFIDFHRKLEKS